jgi:hypothetical protein
MPNTRITEAGEHDMPAYLGTWQLIPELSHYDQGGPPERGLYRIEDREGVLHFTIDWTKTGQDYSVAYIGHADGSPVLNPHPGVDQASVRHEDDFTLSGSAMSGGVEIARAMRRVAHDGTLMSVLQETADGKGGFSRILQVYRRV